MSLVMLGLSLFGSYAFMRDGQCFAAMTAAFSAGLWAIDIGRAVIRWLVRR